MTQLPSKSEILDWITQNPTQTSKRDIAKAFGIKGAARIDLKRLLRELEDEGHLTKRQKTYRDPDKLPPVAVLLVLAPDDQGDLFARPLEWHGEGPEPRVLMNPRDSDTALGEGDRILARLTEERSDDYAYTGRLIRKIGSNPQRILGVFRTGAEGGRIQPIDKGTDREWTVPPGATHDAKDGELVEAEQAGPRGRMGLPKARIVTRLGDPTAPRAVSLIAIHQHGIPDHFPDRVIQEADNMKPANMKGREDLRHLPFVTIDPADARDHDDACFVEANGDGHVLWVAIADVAHYVRSGTPLDTEARKRGNSSYFPDRVVPMLPDRLSGDLCSLHEGVPRPVLVARMEVSADGTKTGHSFHRAMILSAASFSYEEVQQAMDGHPTDRAQRMMETVIKPLYACYASLKQARERRQPLELDLPERQIKLSEDGTVASVDFKDRLDAHKLIEEFMVLANVAAAEELIARKSPLLFRVHEEPADDKLDALRETAAASGLTLAKGQVLKTAHLNRLLDQAAGTELSELISISTLRSMTQAYYHSDNKGHFGLALRSYAHFTSPIRRYADLLVHRALIRSHGWGNDGLSPEDETELDATAKHISETERRSMTAERDTTDRYLAAYLADRVGTEATGRINGIAKFGVFVKLTDTGADVLVPMRALGDEYFHYDRDAQTLMGSDSGIEIGLGTPALVRLTEADPVTGGLVAEMVELDGKTMPKGRGRGDRGPKRGAGKRPGKGPRDRDFRDRGPRDKAPRGRSAGHKPPRGKGPRDSERDSDDRGPRGKSASPRSGDGPKGKPRGDRPGGKPKGRGGPPKGRTVKRTRR